jgi:hypothetical protein
VPFLSLLGGFLLVSIGRGSPCAGEVFGNPIRNSEIGNRFLKLISDFRIHNVLFNKDLKWKKSDVGTTKYT